MGPHQPMVKSRGNVIDRIGPVFKLHLDVAKQFREFHSNKPRIDPNVFFTGTKAPGPFPGPSEHMFVKVLGKLEREWIQVSARECPAFTVQDILLFPLVQLPLRGDVGSNEPGAFIGIERRRAFRIDEFQSHSFRGFSDRISSVRRAS